MKETAGNLKTDNMQHDKNFNHDLCSEIGICIEREDIRFLTRVGQKNQERTVNGW